MRNNKKPKTPAHPSPKTTDGRLHHWLAAAKLKFTIDGREGLGEHETNITLTNDRRFVTANMIGRAQQMVQVQLNEMMGGDPSLKILSVHLQSINYLGVMSREEFYTAPLETPDEAGGAETGDILEAVPPQPDAFSTTN